MVIAAAQCDQRGRREAYEAAKAAEHLNHGGEEGYCRAKLEKQHESEILDLAALEANAVAEAGYNNVAEVPAEVLEILLRPIAHERARLTQKFSGSVRLLQLLQRPLHLSR